MKKRSGDMGRFFCAFFVLIGITLLGTTSAVIAADESPAKAGPYIVGGVGLSDFNVSNSDLRTLNTGLLNLGFNSAFSSTDNTGVYLKGHGGYNVSKHFAVEGGFTSLGQLEVNTILTGPVETLTTTADVYGFEASGLGKIKIGNSFAYLRLGLIAWSADITASSSLGSASFNQSGTDPTVGIGWQFGKQKGVRVEYQYYPIGDAEIQTVHLSGVYSF